MTDPIRSALKRLLSAVLDGLGQDDHPMGWARVDDAIDAARAALAAEPDGPAVPEGREPAAVVGEPSDEELDVLADEWLDWNLEGHRSFARAVLARYRHQPAPPVAEGEVGELVEGLKLISDGMDAMGHESDSWFVARAADLLSQRHPAPAPVAAGEVGEVGEFLRDWGDDYADKGTKWHRAADLLEQLEDLAADAVSGLRYIEQTHGRLYGVGWDRVYEKADRLQAVHALPLSAEEVE